MVLTRMRDITLILLIFCLTALLLAACAGGAQHTQAPATPVPPKPTEGAGQQLLAVVSQKLNDAQTLHGLFHFMVSGPDADGAINTEVWNAQPGKSRTLVQQSSLPRYAPAGSVIVSDGKQIWQYDPTKQVVYTGAVSDNTNNTPDGRGQFLLNLLQIVLTRSDGTLVSSSATINGHAADDVQVTSQQADENTGNGANNVNYDGDIYIDKATLLPLALNLTLQGVGKVGLNLSQLTLNVPIAASIFTFVIPSGVKVLPLQQANSGSLTLTEAEQQAGYHLLSISASQSAYALQSINALGAPGNQIYTLTYAYGQQTFTIAEGKPLANLPLTGQQVSIRHTSGTLSTTNGTTTLAWTEQGIGIHISGNGLSNQQLMTIANLLI